jgi:hypothetical protein
MQNVDNHLQEIEHHPGGVALRLKAGYLLHDEVDGRACMEIESYQDARSNLSISLARKVLTRNFTEETQIFPGPTSNIIPESVFICS